MSKRKLTADEAVANILRFVEDSDDVDDGDAADELNEIYDDGDINVAQEKSDDDSSSDSDDGHAEDSNQRLGWSNPSTSHQMKTVMSPVTLLLLKIPKMKQIWLVFWVQRKTQKPRKSFGWIKSHRMPGTKELVIFYREVLNHQHCCHLPLESIPWLMPFMCYLKMKWFNWLLVTLMLKSSI